MITSRPTLSDADYLAQELMKKLKADGMSSEQIGYDMAVFIYGPSPSKGELTMFETGLNMIQNNTTLGVDDQEFLYGGRRWLEEMKAKVAE